MACDDESSLALADGSHQVDYADPELFQGCLHYYSFQRMQRREVAEDGFFGEAVRVFEVDGLDTEQSEIFFGILWRANLARDGVARSQAKRRIWEGET